MDRLDLNLSELRSAVRDARRRAAPPPGPAVFSGQARASQSFGSPRIDAWPPMSTPATDQPSPEPVRPEPVRNWFLRLFGG